MPYPVAAVRGKNFGASVDPYITKVLGIESSNLIGYWTMDEGAGSVANDQSPENNDGTYTGVSLANAASPTGIGLCPLFDGSNDFNDVYSSAFNTDFNGQEFTVSIWAKVSASGVWADATNRYFCYFGVGAQDLIGIRKSTVENRVDFLYTADATAKSRVDTSLAATTAWFHLALTVSKTGDAMKAYINGSQAGATISGLGTFEGNLNSSNTVVGAISTGPASVWDGWEAHVAVWKAALSGPNITSLAAV